MIYTPMTKKAINLMYSLHKNQVDKAGLPYVFHPYHLAEQMSDENSTIVALLHDVLEDTEITENELKKEGFSNEVISALKLLTHDSNENYYSYVKKIGNSEIARKVKIKDLEHNMDLRRLGEVTELDLERYNKYVKCHQYLLEIEEQNKVFKCK